MIEESIKISWNANTISAIEENGQVQIFDGRNRLMALKSLGIDNFVNIFGVKTNFKYGVKIHIFHNLTVGQIIEWSQSTNYYFNYNRFEQPNINIC